MTPAQHRHLVGFLGKLFGQADILLVGDAGSMRVVLPDAELLVFPHGHRPSAAENRYFSFCFASASASPRERELLRLLDRGLERYARRFPWLVRAVRIGSVHLENSPRMLRRLADSAHSHSNLFRALERLRDADENRTPLARELFDFDALQEAVFRVANSAVPLDAGRTGEGVPLPRRGKPLDWPDGLRAVFLDALPENGDLSAELSLWVSGLEGRGTRIRASEWGEVRSHMSPDTVVFYAGLERDCVRFLLEHRDRFRRVVFWDAGLSHQREALPAGLLQDGKASFYLTSPNNYFGELFPRLPPERRMPYVPIVTRNILRYKLTSGPDRDLFVCTNLEQDLSFLLRHQRFFSERKLMIGVKRHPDPAGLRVESEARYLETCREVRIRLPDALFVPTVPQDLHFYLWQTARNVAVLYPETWDKTSYTLAAALASGRGVVTTAHPAIAGIDPGSLLFYDPRARYSDRGLSALFCGEETSKAAARSALRFARRQLEFSLVLERIVRQTLEDIARKKTV